MTDLPDNAIELEYDDVTNSYVMPPTHTLDNWTVVAIPVPDPEPLTLAERMSSWVHAEGVGFEFNDDTEYYAAMIQSLRLVSRDDPEEATLEPLDGNEVWSTIRRMLRAAVDECASHTGEPLHARLDVESSAIANAVVARFGVPACPTVTQVMEALGCEWSAPDEWEVVWRRSDGLGRRQEITHRDATEALTAIGIRPDEI